LRCSRLLILVSCWLASSSAVAQEIIKYRTADGQLGFAQDASGVPPGAEIVDSNASGKAIVIQNHGPPAAAPAGAKERAAPTPPRKLAEPVQLKRECTPRPTGQFENGAPVVDLNCRMVESDEEPPEFDRDAYDEHREALRERHEAEREAREEALDADDSEWDEQEKPEPRRARTGPGGRPLVQPVLR
jgi:hypothetical protein